METTAISSQNSCVPSLTVCKGLRITFIVLAILATTLGILGFLKVGVFSNLGNLGSALACSGAFICLITSYFCKNERTDFFNLFEGRVQVDSIMEMVKKHPERMLWQDDNGNTALHLLADVSTTVVDDHFLKLIESIAKMKDTCKSLNKLGEYPLYLAIKNGNHKIVAILNSNSFNAGVDPSKKARGDNFRLIDLAVSQFIDPQASRYNVLDSKGRTLDSRLYIIKLRIEDHNRQNLGWLPWNLIPQNRRAEMEKELRIPL